MEEALVKRILPHSPEAERVDLRYTLMGADLTIPISLEVTEP